MLKQIIVSVRIFAISKVGCTMSNSCGHKPCSQKPTYDTPATAGKQATAVMLSTARIPAATGIPALSKGHKQERRHNLNSKKASNCRICVEKL
jgi:hypothetical protein